MFKEMEMGGHPHTMTVMAQAVWNAKAGHWEVSVVQSETCRVMTGDYTFDQRVNQLNVRTCDEFVIATALLHANGIDVKGLYDVPEHPIVGEE